MQIGKATETLEVDCSCAYI
uniref:Uncharacterized protein n=1 Tax=Rhizophora mucronata TaxID=61149 RepID=A0A2P2N227_RHIMU